MQMSFTPPVERLARRMFPEQVATKLVAPEPYGPETSLEGHELRIIEQGRTDSADSTSLYVPSIGLIVAGDVVYNQCRAFTNLHIVYSYYQTANAIFIIAAVGLGLAAVISVGQIGVALAFLAMIATAQLLYFRSAYADFVTNDYSADREFRIANIAKSATELDASLIVIGDDWASVVPYYAQRKSFALSNWAPVSLWQRILATPQKFLGDRRLGGVVYCADMAPHEAERQKLVSEFVSGRPVLGEADGCQFLAPNKK